MQDSLRFTARLQYWRLLVHHVACGSSSDLLLTELILYNAAIHIERAFGSVKYSVSYSSNIIPLCSLSFQSFLLIALGLNTTATMLTQLLFQLVPILGTLSNHIPPGPTALVFSILYQFFRLVPEAYKFRIFGVTMSDKFWVYGTASQVSFPSIAFP